MKGSDLAKVEREVLTLYKGIEAYKDYEIIVKIYQSFVNTIFKACHINFFVTSYRVLTQIIMGDRYFEQY